MTVIISLLYDAQMLDIMSNDDILYSFCFYENHFLETYEFHEYCTVFGFSKQNITYNSQHLSCYYYEKTLYSPVT